MLKNKSRGYTELGVSVTCWWKSLRDDYSVILIKKNEINETMEQRRLENEFNETMEQRRLEI